MARPAPVSRPSTLLRRLADGEDFYIEDLIDEAKRYERRAKRRVSLAGGGDPARV